LRKKDGQTILFLCYYQFMFGRQLKELKRKDLARYIISRSSPQGPVITVKGRKYINFSSNDYLGLSGHPEIVKAAVKAAERFGFGAGASRLLAGGSTLHEKLERTISEFKFSESALAFNSGYCANTGIIPAISSEGDVIFSDELNHASIIDGCRLSRAKTVVFRHRNMSHLERLIKKRKARRKIIVTDSVFSMEGDIAPISDLSEICDRYGALLYLDDAHGTGVLGDGRGALAHFRITPAPWILQMGTFSKALGSFGAFAAGSGNVIEWLMNSARSFIFSTALPPCVVSASVAAITLVRKDPSPCKRLWSNRARLIGKLENSGYSAAGSETPIIPIRTGDVGEALRLSGFLWENGIYAPAIRPPSVREPRVRITVTAAHTDRHLSLLSDAMKRFRKG
jgi:8-amino-7-oxononanoate synthase